jgi:hypothetical protein
MSDDDFKKVENKLFQVFISYAREDCEIAKRLYNDLKKAGVTPWMDKYKLLTGQNWKVHITKAVRESKFFIALLSTLSLSKRGFVQKELKLALNILDEFPNEDIFIIPVRTDDCEPADEKLKNLHWADLFPSYEEGLKKILSVLIPKPKNRTLPPENQTPETDINKHQIEKAIKKRMPIILFYGEKSRLDKDFADAFKYGRDHGSCAVIDLSTYQEGGKDYYHFLNDILHKIGDRKAVAAVESEWEKAIDHAEGASRDFFQENSPPAEAERIKAQTVAPQIWAANFAKYGNKPFIEWLSRQSDKYVLIFLKNFEAVSSVLQSAIEQYLIPETEKLSHVKMFIFYEGTSTPSWKTYHFERFIHSVSRINEKLAGFQNPYITGRPVRHSKSGIFVGRQREFRFIRDNLIESDLVLVAERRMGKTSLLVNIKEQLSETYLPVFLDIQNFDKPQDRRTATAMLLWKMAYEICYQLRERLKIGLHTPKNEDFRDMPKQAFEHSFLREQIFPILGDKKLLFL